MGWPAQEVLLNSEVYYSLALAPSLEQTPFLHVLARSTWEAIEVAWESPLCLKVKHPDASQHALGPLARRLQEPQPIINYAAQGAFFNLTKAAVETLSRHLGREVLNGGHTIGQTSKAGALRARRPYHY